MHALMFNKGNCRKLIPITLLSCHDYSEWAINDSALTLKNINHWIVVVILQFFIISF